MSPVRVPQSDELFRSGEPRQRVVGQFADGPGGNVVQDDGQRGGAGNRLKVRVNA